MDSENLRLIVLDNCKELGEKVNKNICDMRGQDISYIVPIKETRFNNGEGKIEILDTIRDKDVFILSDVGNHSCTYRMFGYENHMGPDEHFQDIKRVIYAIRGHTENINIVMPLLYESRQHRRKGRESLDCANGLQELIRLGAKSILTFDVHDVGIQNAVPLNSFENIFPTNTIINEFIEHEKIDFKNLIIVSPDTGAVDRAKFYANIFKTNIGMFYKSRDLTQVINGKNPIKEHKYIGDDVSGKNIIVVDDIIASGDSMIDVARRLKELNAAKVYMIATFSLFTEGLERFNKAYEEGLFEKIYSTNLSYISKETKNQPWFHEVDCSYQIAELINDLNNKKSITPLMNGRQKVLERINQKIK
ncbi:MAG: ribose-phosphate diphosphokinase [Bacilli bacterium]|mgnify:CR=1 FL=1|nr:ribose-phosphate diphosphokinase [Bacilli bacterium]MDD4607932.1 ribose-phosphate diphosphokinase [Bacilli bacterium]